MRSYLLVAAVFAVSCCVLQVSATSHICPTCLDVAVAVESSSSVGEFRWTNRIKPFLREIAKSDYWTIGTTGDTYQGAIISFNETVTLRWNWGATQTSTKQKLLLAIKNELPYMGGTANTGEAMKAMRTSILTDSDNRDACKDLCVVMTDGIPNGGISGDLFKEQFPLLKEQCDKTIIIIAGGDDPTEAELAEVSLTSDDVMIVKKWIDLKLDLMVAQVFCQAVS